MELYNVFNQILIIFIILLVGYAAKKLNAVSEPFCRGLAEFVSNITLPAYIISSMKYSFSFEMLLLSGKLLIACGVVYLLSTIVAYLVPVLFKINKEKKGVFQFMLVFSNVGFMGIPVINAVYGSKGVFYAAIFNMPFNFLIWTLGVILLQNTNNRKKISMKKLINPGTVSVLIGFTIFIFSIKLPVSISTTIDMLGSITTPLSMFYIGTMLANVKINQLFSDRLSFGMTFVRLIILPLIILVVLKPFVSNQMLLGIPVILTAMPAAANTAIMADIYDNDVYAASQGIFISTMLSVATIPLFALILSYIE